MTLLQNARSRYKLKEGFKKYSVAVCFVSYVVGCLWFGLLAYMPVNNQTYISEHALLPGLVDNQFIEQSLVKSHLKHLLKHELNETNQEKYIPYDYILNEFRQFGLDVYEQNFNTTVPVGNMKLYGTNIYAILRAPRAASTEAIVLSTSYDFIKGQSSAPAVALMLALAKHFYGRPYLSKDIIFLIADQDRIGVQAWLESYHYTLNENPLITTGSLSGRAGSIQAAINLEMYDETFKSLDVRVEGLNGQMPNLDLVNTAVGLCRRGGVKSSIVGRVNHKDPMSLRGFAHSLKTMLIMMFNQASCYGTGHHGLYHRYHIEAVTLATVKPQTESTKTATRINFVDVALILEGTLRSINNLLERFHQSFFFYLLPATTRYISIGVYMPPFSLIVIPTVIKALSLFLSLMGDEESVGSNPNTGGDTNTAKLSEDSASVQLDHDSVQLQKDQSQSEQVQSPGDGSDLSQNSSKSGPHMFSILPIMIIVHVLGIVLYLSPTIFTTAGKIVHLGTDVSLLNGIASVFLAAIIFPSLIRRNHSTIDDGSMDDRALIKCFALFEFALIIFAVSLFNISLAVFISVICVPVYVSAAPRQGMWSQLLQSILLLLVSPLVLLCVAIVTYTALTDGMSAAVTMSSLLRSLSSGILLTIIDSYIHHNWLFPVISNLILPNWLMFWYVHWK